MLDLNNLGKGDIPRIPSDVGAFLQKAWEACVWNRRAILKASSSQSGATTTKAMLWHGRLSQNNLAGFGMILNMLPNTVPWGLRF